MFIVPFLNNTHNLVVIDGNHRLTYKVKNKAVVLFGYIGILYMAQRYAIIRKGESQHKLMKPGRTVNFALSAFNGRVKDIDGFSKIQGIF
ncbi:hypothetical protein DFR58_10644 [Anaerobacterium chartisolvens]|uniref:Uncharacterized protein n=1 Tax=Anaerobacterium chartisolvens TaxID=1297424 RepID=A0A369BBD8_9FIRM|nr:hypothetical protein DFR58_10644 [Anaerobacterium chartisolvens]